MPRWEERKVQLITDFLTNPAQALITWFPLLFAVGYQAIFQPIGWTTWSLIIAAPALIPLLIVAVANGANQVLQETIPAITPAASSIRWSSCAPATWRG